jgi:caffeoyl-CoA O-methyltransferase
VLEGPGLTILPRIEQEGPFDAVFVDADKPSYGAYAEWAARNLRPGGLLIGDNTYLFGRLAGVAPEGAGDAQAIAGMRRFHEVVASQFEGVTLPTPDGLSVGVKSAIAAVRR